MDIQDDIPRDLQGKSDDCSEDDIGDSEAAEKSTFYWEFEPEDQMSHQGLTTPRGVTDIPPIPSMGPWEAAKHYFAIGANADGTRMFRVPFCNTPMHYLIDAKCGEMSFVDEKDVFKVLINMKHFKPEDITVKPFEGGMLVEGKNEDKENEGDSVSRQFWKRFLFPKGADYKAVTSNYSVYGVLTVTVPKIKKLEEGIVQTVPITQTGKPNV